MVDSRYVVAVEEVRARRAHPPLAQASGARRRAPPYSARAPARRRAAARHVRRPGWRNRRSPRTRARRTPCARPDPARCSKATGATTSGSLVSKQEKKITASEFRLVACNSTRRCHLYATPTPGIAGRAPPRPPAPAPAFLVGGEEVPRRRANKRRRSCEPPPRLILEDGDLRQVRHLWVAALEHQLDEGKGTPQQVVPGGADGER